MKKLKKILKNIIITILIIFGVGLLIVIVFGIYTDKVGYEPGTAEKKPPELTYKIEGDVRNQADSDKRGAIKGFAGMTPEEEEQIPDEKYYATIEEAIENKDWSETFAYAKNIETIITCLEGEEYATIFYRAVKNKKVECILPCKMKVKEIDGERRYAFLITYPIESYKGAKYQGDSTNQVESCLSMIDYETSLGVGDQDERFVYGIHFFDNIYSLKIEGQEPTEIIPYEFFGRTEYLWYYEDLQSDKPGYLLEYEMDEIKDYKKLLK